MKVSDLDTSLGSFYPLKQEKRTGDWVKDSRVLPYPEYRIDKRTLYLDNSPWLWTAAPECLKWSTFNFSSQYQDIVKQTGNENKGVII